MTDLLDLLREQEHAVDPRRDWVHVCLPNMGYACGNGNICGLVDGGPGGHQMFGANKTTWGNVTCPDCRALGLREVRRRTHIITQPPGHECASADECDWLNEGAPA